MTIANCKVTTVGLLLFQLLSVISCIPVTQFYPFGEDAISDATNGVSGLQVGNDVSSTTVYVNELIQFYGEPEDSVIVSLSNYTCRPHSIEVPQYSYIAS